MTNEEAIAEARRRWGSDAWIQIEEDRLQIEPTVLSVGYSTFPDDGPMFEITKGIGASWAEAFDMAGLSN